MSRVEVIGDCTLYLGDCRDILPSLKGVDCCISDPPYLVSKGGYASNLQLDGGFGGWLRDYGNQGDIVLCDIDFSEWLQMVHACLKSDAQVYFMTNGRNIKDMQTAAEEALFRIHTVLVWDKRAALPNRYYQNVTEFALFMFKGKARTINNPSSKNLVSIFQRDVSEHPTEKPVELMALWAQNSTAIGDTILDPFMGSGTTRVACAQLSRKFIGIERELKYFDVARMRIEEAYRQPSLFIDKPSVTPSQATLFGLES